LLQLLPKRLAAKFKIHNFLFTFFLQDKKKVKKLARCGDKFPEILLNSCKNNNSSSGRKTLN